MEVITIPTERKGSFLRTVTELEDKAWLLTNRPFTHPLPPNKLGAPDYQAFIKLRAVWEKSAANDFNMGIWDKRPQGIAFAGYVTLKRDQQHKKSAVIGVEIAEKHREKGYASLALNAIMKYGREELGYETYVADILSKNQASRNMVESLGFEFSKKLSEQQPGHAIYMHNQLAGDRVATPNE